jgi:hypothetical protein
MQPLTFAISILAILLSGASLFLQYFHRPRRLRVITMPYGRNGEARFGICNASKESVYLTGLSVFYSIPKPDGSSRQCAVERVVSSTSIIDPGKICEFSYSSSRPPKQFLDTAPESTGPTGEVERTVDVVVFIQFAFPDAKIYSNWFKAGMFSAAENSTSWSVEALNLDLLRSALPVQNKMRSTDDEGA